MKVDHKAVSVLEDDVQLVVVYDGPRGMPGAEGAPGRDGKDGQSIRVRGDWMPSVAYAHGDAVAWRASKNPGLTALYFVREGYSPKVGEPPNEHPEAWVEIGSGGPMDGNANAVIRVHQVNHNFQQVGAPVAFAAATGRWEAAAATDIDLVALGVVCDIVDQDEFAIQFSGRVDGVAPELIEKAGRPQDWQLGRIYYLSPSPGEYTTRNPSDKGYISQPMIVPVHAEHAFSPADVILLTWGPQGLSDAVPNGPAPPPRPEVGDLWFRTEDWPGLYMAMPAGDGSSVTWVQTNG